MNLPGIFLSHNREDREFARRLADDLKRYGARVWIDEAEIGVGDRLLDKIQKGIDDMDYLAVILSPASVHSEWVKTEVDIAMNQEIEGRRVKVLPLLRGQCNLPSFLVGKRWADFTSEDKYEDALRLVVTRLGLYRIPRHLCLSHNAFLDIAHDRLRGHSAVATSLCSVIDQDGECSDLARFELACHELARQREHRSIRSIEALAKGSGNPFVGRGFALLLSMCHAVRGNNNTAAVAIGDAPDHKEMTRREVVYLAFLEGIVSIALGHPDRADRVWKDLWAFVVQSDPGPLVYPLVAITRAFDRCVLRVALGLESVQEIAESVPYTTYRGAAHLSVVFCRVLRKCPGAAESIVVYGRSRKWQRLPDLPVMRGRLRDYEHLILSNAGTLFPARPEGQGRSGAAG